MEIAKLIINSFRDGFALNMRRYNSAATYLLNLRKYEGESRRQETLSHGAYKVTVGVNCICKSLGSPCRRAFIISYEIFATSPELVKAHGEKEKSFRYGNFSNGIRKDCRVFRIPGTSHNFVSFRFAPCKFHPGGSTSWTKRQISAENSWNRSLPSRGRARNSFYLLYRCR